MNAPHLFDAIESTTHIFDRLEVARWDGSMPMTDFVSIIIHIPLVYGWPHLTQFVFGFCSVSMFSLCRIANVLVFDVFINLFLFLIFIVY